jgi:hypothetical protein
MNEADAGRFLAMAAVLDSKMPRPDAKGFVRGVWARQLAEIPFDAAEKAMQAYYSSERYLTSREPISAADVVQWWNARRRPNERERNGTAPRRALPRATFDPERIHDGVDRVFAELARLKAEKAGVDPVAAADEAEGEVAYRRQVLTVDCPHCRAGAGRACVRVGRKEGTRVELSRYHPSRVEAATAIGGSP